jgi:methionine--tRNA ligase beta chain
MNESKPTIKFEDFSKIDMRIGTVVSAEEVEGSEKLIKMEVDFGEIGRRQILGGLKSWYEPKDLEGKQIPFVINIEPRKMMGLESQGMVLAVESSDRAVLLFPKESVENGALLL